MTQSSDLLETAQNEAAQIVDHHVQVEISAVRRFRLSTIGFFAGLILFFLGNMWLQWGLEMRVREPLPPVVAASLTPDKLDPVVCPGDGIPYTLKVDTDHDTIVEIDAVIRNLATKRTEIPSTTTRTIVEAGQTTFRSTYVLPVLLPATNILPERAWKAGNYQRILALTGIEGLRQSSVTYMSFRVGADCPGVAK